MPVEVKVPEVGESISEVQIGRWLKAPGEHVNQYDPVVEIESDKATVEVSAPVAGTLSQILKQTGEVALIGDLIAYMEEGVATETPSSPPPPKEVGAPKHIAPKRPSAPAPSPAPLTPKAMDDEEDEDEDERPVRSPETPRSTAPATATPSAGEGSSRIMPAAQRVMEEYGLGTQDVQGTGPGGRVLKSDAQHAAQGRKPIKQELPPASVPGAQAIPRPVATPQKSASPPLAPLAPTEGQGEREDEIVPMTPMRRRIAERLIQAQQTAALLTTFNEIDMSGVIALRDEHKQEFAERHGVKLGFMSFFVKAIVSALRYVPQVNAEIRGSDIVYHHYYDIGVAVGGGKGLVVPILRNADRMTFTQIEKAIADFAQRAKENRLGIEELQGGTFTVSNGGIYGSLLSTPIVNPPQSGILGMHAIQDRPVAHNGQVVIRPMMYIALTYDHRLVDGREAVTFLRHVKEDIEDPTRLMLDL